MLWTLYMLNFIWIFFLRSAHVKIFLDLENINEGLEYGTKVSMFMLRWMFMGKCLRVLAPPLLSVLRIPVIQKHQLPHITYSEAFILVNHTLNHTRQSFQNIWLHIFNCNVCNFNKDFCNACELKIFLSPTYTLDFTITVRF